MANKHMRRAWENELWNVRAILDEGRDDEGRELSPSARRELEEAEKTLTAKLGTKNG